MKSAFGIIALKNAKGDFFFKAECLKHHLIFGCNHSHKANTWHSTEILYDLKNEIKGIRGLPLTFVWSGEYVLNPFSTMKYKLDVKNEALTSFSWTQRVNDNLRIIVSDHYNLTRLFTDPSKTNYNFGCLLEYTV